MEESRLYIQVSTKMTSDQRQLQAKGRCIMFYLFLDNMTMTLGDKMCRLPCAYIKESEWIVDHLPPPRPDQTSRLCSTDLDSARQSEHRSFVSEYGELSSPLRAHKVHCSLSSGDFSWTRDCRIH